jgi:5-methylcytosine-specific restriction endonuclease McrA
MRRVYRGSLPLETRLDLFRRGKQVTSVASAQALWRTYRQSSAVNPVVQELTRMAGPRGRCLYCSGSLGADVDHFAPVAHQFGMTFTWENMLWVCPVCNRKKGRRFPTGPNGQPLIMNPAREDPWQHLVLDTSTGVLAPRFVIDGPDPIGEATLVFCA